MPSPEDGTRANKNWLNAVARRARAQTRTKDKRAIAQVTLDGGQISIQSAEDCHRAHKKYMQAQERDKI